MFCEKRLVEAACAAKGRMDALWSRPPPPMARSLISRVARAQLFHHSGEGGQEHENRAGDKLAQISELMALLDGVPEGSAFLDLCGGPGAWSQHLLDHPSAAPLGLRGFGFTLRPAAGESEDWKSQDKDMWYQDLCERSNWIARTGLEITRQRHVVPRPVRAIQLEGVV